MKYMIFLYGSQQDYDALSGRAVDKPAWSAQEFAAMGAFMEAFNQALVDSGELVETRGLTAPVHARRIQLQNGVPVVTDGPYAEAQEVLAGYWVVECESFDRATDIATQLSKCPGPEYVTASVIDVRPIAEGREELDIRARSQTPTSRTCCAIWRRGSLARWYAAMATSIPRRTRRRKPSSPQRRPGRQKVVQLTRSAG